MGVPVLLRLTDFRFLPSSSGPSVLRRLVEGAVGGELPLWKGFSAENGLSCPKAFHVSGTDSSCFIAGAADVCRDVRDRDRAVAGALGVLAGAGVRRLGAVGGAMMVSS